MIIKKLTRSMANSLVTGFVLTDNKKNYGFNVWQTFNNWG